MNWIRTYRSEHTILFKKSRREECSILQTIKIPQIGLDRDADPSHNDLWFRSW